MAVQKTRTLVATTHDMRLETLLRTDGPLELGHLLVDRGECGLHLPLGAAPGCHLDGGTRLAEAQRL